MEIVWTLRKEELALHHDVCSIPSLFIMLNIIAWNCRGALKPSFQDHINELAHRHDPTILVVMETKVGGARAKEITDRLPFNGAIHTETIGYAGGL